MSFTYRFITRAKSAHHKTAGLLRRFAARKDGFQLEEDGVQFKVAFSKRAALSAILLFMPWITNAMDFYAEGLYWQASETVDWVLTNNLNSTHQTIAYQTLSFHPKPGFRLGLGVDGSQFDTRALYSHYQTSTTDTSGANSISTFFGGKFTSPFYQAGQASMKINFNVIDLDLLYNQLNLSDHLLIRPTLGLRGAWIDQTIITQFQNPISVVETVQNNFTGVGIKGGMENKFYFLQTNNATYSVIANFAASFLFGNWSIHDQLTSNNARPPFNVDVGKRDFGAPALEALLGMGFDYSNVALVAGYEVADWYNQYQVFDDGTGAHNDDLMLQGLTLKLKVHWA